MNIGAVIAQFELQTSWFLNALENISEQESNIRLAENLNPIKWVAGHLTDARMTIHSLISGESIQEEYKKLFGKGTSAEPTQAFPTLEEIKVRWVQISEKLKPALHLLPEEKLLAQPPFQTSIPDETLIGLIAYFSMHESFHIGQISVYRKLTGKPAMAMGKR